MFVALCGEYLSGYILVNNISWFIKLREAFQVLSIVISLVISIKFLLISKLSKLERYRTAAWTLLSVRGLNRVECLNQTSTFCRKKSGIQQP